MIWQTLLDFLNRPLMMHILSWFFHYLIIMQYSNGEQADTSFEFTNDTFRLFLGLLLFIEYQKLRDCKTDWETPPDTFV